MFLLSGRSCWGCLKHVLANKACSAGLLVQETESELDHILSRGIDPSMLDPTQCHSHPEAPQEWPSRPELCKYVQQVRDQQA